MRLFFSIALLSVLLLAALGYLRLAGERTEGVFDVQPPTPYFHYAPRAAPPLGRLLVVHGLGGSKEVMNMLSYALADSGYEVYSIDLPGHGDSQAGFNAMLSLNVLRAVLERLGTHTVVLGHSLGAGLLLDLANERRFDSMVLLSPPPTNIGRIDARRVLVLTGQFDLPPVRAFTRRLDGAHPVSIDLRTVRMAGHTGLILRPTTPRWIVEWLGGNPESIYFGERYTLLICMLITAAGLGGVLLWGGKPVSAGTGGLGGPQRTTVVAYVAASVAAFLVSAVAVVFEWLRLFGTDYLIGFVFVAGLTLCVFTWAAHAPRDPRSWRGSWRPPNFAPAALAAAYVIILPVVLIGSELAHTFLSPGRLWRFPVIAAASIPLLLADEVYLRPIRPWWKAAAAAMLTRLILGGFIATGVLTANRGDSFLVLIVHLVILFWLALWLAGDLVHNRTQDRLATAAFGALVQGWMFASLFIAT